MPHCRCRYRYRQTEEVSWGLAHSDLIANLLHRESPAAAAAAQGWSDDVVSESPLPDTLSNLGLPAIHKLQWLQHHHHQHHHQYHHHRRQRYTDKRRTGEFQHQNQTSLPQSVQQGAMNFLP
ncbi:uncharacterized protein K489DRAFT_124812 [Dissoconium aciculare CBS 342.82]|uniref:Uncharacterized protein n=1 Tax=Dissoconium aciculare CBS 342.82 TaxID=1314786 RepID=A0A6J3MFG5_9PEZI|nr:uncharacterized protein K489DRAFT_124812 [Dissoconium aciculare CBS 342.82]KAF1826751.1 hypothetical protein K489DRAFT_124812 [Dissoconium aciculare CBS 342.82]